MSEQDTRKLEIKADGKIYLYTSSVSGFYSIKGTYKVVSSSPLKLKVNVTDQSSDLGPECPHSKKPFTVIITFTDSFYIITSERPECGKKWDKTEFIEEK